MSMFKVADWVIVTSKAYMLSYALHPPCWIISPQTLVIVKYFIMMTVPLRSGCLRLCFHPLSLCP